MRTNGYSALALAVACVALASCGSDEVAPAAGDTLPPPDAAAARPAESAPAPSDELAVEVSPTVFAPPEPLASDAKLPSLEEMQAISTVRPADVKTVALDTARDEPVWLTTWTGETASGTWVYCVGTSHYGHNCVPDFHGVDKGLQVREFSTDGPSFVSFIADGSLESLSVQIGDEGAPVELELIDLGLPSGYQLAAYVAPEGTDLAGELTFAGDFTSSPSRAVQISLPAGDPQVQGRAAPLPDLGFEPVELRETTQND